MNCFKRSIIPTRLSISLLAALLLLSLANISLAQNTPKEDPQNSAQLRQQIERSKEKLSKARKQRKDAFPKGRHDMKDKKTREKFVRQIKEAEGAHMEAVREHAALRGLKLEGEKANGGNFRLIDFDKNGAPIYEETMNIDAAITTAADQVRDDSIYQAAIKVEAEIAHPNNHSGIQVESTTDDGGGQNIGYIDNGDWAEYTINVPTAGQYSLNIRTASNNNDGGTINLSADGSSIGSVIVPDTNGWQDWTTIRTLVTFTTAGSQTLRMDFVGGAGALFNVNWFSYNPAVIIGQWETGTARLTHRELSGKVSIWDSTSNTTDHATHVAGTLVARGINANTLGMAPDATLAAFSSGFADTEMMDNAAAAPSTTQISISNHSYGVTRGWRYDDDDNIWEWKGEYTPGGNQADFYDEDFGRYRSRSVTWDNITYNNPYYVMFVSAGNGRENVPPTNDPWRYVDNFSTITVPSYDSSIHPLSNRYYTGDDKGYDTMEGGTLAKNSIAVGSSTDAVDSNGDRDLGVSQAQNYSCRGPADDGRIKPDIYANGAGLTSSTAGSDSSTASYSGTSMSSPNACGSAALLIGYYSARFPGQAMRASTLKALILHTADDQGKDGPDYKYGWGVMNTKFAADVIKNYADGTGDGYMIESTINDTTTTSESHAFDWDGTSPLRVTICWTDPAGDEIEGHNNRTQALVNDLNLKVIGPGGTHYPYVMPYVGDWSTSKFETKATTGVNDVDNVEQVYLAAPTAGTYTVVVDYVGSITNDSQVYSLIVTGQTVAATPAEIEVEADGPPIVALSSGGAAQDFGSTAPSDPTVVKNYTIRNTGGSPLTGLNITKSGSHPSDFTVSSLSATQLLTNETAIFSVSYDPLDIGTRTAQLNIANNDSDENPFVINLTAVGLSDPQEAEIEVEADGPPIVALTSGGAAQDFGSTAPSDPTVIKNYTIRNTGTGPLTGLVITKSGSHPSDFAASSLSATELSTGETANFTVSYDPLDLGTRTAQLNIASNDNDENPFVINLTAFGLSEIQGWRLEHFGTTSVRGISADNADYDKDGHINLIEFAMATDPTTPNVAPMTFTNTVSTIDLTYDRNVNAMVDYDFQVKWNDDLTNPAGWFDTSVTEQILSDDGSVQEVKATAPKDSATQRFLQLYITPK